MIDIVSDLAFNIYVHKYSLSKSNQLNRFKKLLLFKNKIYKAKPLFFILIPYENTFVYQFLYFVFDLKKKHHSHLNYRYPGMLPF